MSSPLNTTLPRRGGLKPTIEFTSVVLPTPLRPSRPRIWPCSSCERQALQHVGVAVISVDVLDFEDRRHGSVGPQIDFLHPGAVRGSARGVPVSRISPKCSTEICRATSNTTSMSCSISRIASLGSSFIRNLAISVDSPDDRPAAGSSSSRIFGSLARPSTISSWRCSPCDRLRTSTSLRSRKLACSSR